MTTDYNDIARQYRQAKEHAWRARIECPSMLALVGDVSGLVVVDMACGEGYYTRRLRLAGARRVVGIDLSQEMIALAQAEEVRAPLGIEYRVGDARAAAGAGRFDLALAAWLLVYARSNDELGEFCRGLAGMLRSGARLVTIVNNLALGTTPPADYRKYGFQVRLNGPASEGTPIRWTILLDAESFEIENYYLSAGMLESALAAAGFEAIAFRPLTLAPSPDGQDDRDFWEDFLAHPPAVLLEARRS